MYTVTQMCAGMCQVAAIRKMRGRGKAVKLAALVHSAIFMERYQNDLSTRDTRLKELSHHWYHAFLVFNRLIL